MKEKYDWWYSKESENIKKELENLFKDKKIRKTEIGFVITPKHFYFVYHLVAKIRFSKKQIIIYDKNCYTKLKTFAEKHNFETFEKHYEEE